MDKLNFLLLLLQLLLVTAIISIPFDPRNIYYIMEDAGEWKVGAIVSDGSLGIVSFAEDNNVREIFRSWMQIRI